MMVFRRCWKLIRLAEKDVSQIRKFSTAPPSPLEGIRVLDMTRLVSYGAFQSIPVRVGSLYKVNLWLVKIDETLVTGFWLVRTAQ